MAQEIPARHWVQTVTFAVTERAICRCGIPRPKMGTDTIFLQKNGRSNKPPVAIAQTATPPPSFCHGPYNQRSHGFTWGGGSLGVVSRKLTIHTALVSPTEANAHHPPAAARGATDRRFRQNVH